MKPFFTAAIAAMLAFAPLCGKAQSLNNIPVTKDTSAKFTWVDWNKAPQALKEATKLINTETGQTLYKFIQSVLTDEYGGNPRVDIALIDLNNDGVLGIGVHLQSRTWCGTAGCEYELYDNAGIIYVTLSDYDLKPASNGVRSSAKKFFVLEHNKKCQYHGLRDTPAIFITKKL